jgi:hypothetical protein
VIPRTRIHAAAALLATVPALGVPAAAQAGSVAGIPAPNSGGASILSPPPGVGSAVPTGNPLVKPGNVTVSASGAGMTVSTTASALLRNQLEFTGSVPTRDSGAAVEIQRLGRQTNWTWQPTAQATVNPDGTFAAEWRTNHIGRFAVRVVVATADARAAAASPALSITIYRPSIATWYGPGFFGRRTACGLRLGRSTLGVANKQLPCGTNVALYYRGRTMTVPVVDRGPFANHAEWDLTQATRRALGMDGTTTIGAVSVPTRPR